MPEVAPAVISYSFKAGIVFDAFFQQGRPRPVWISNGGWCEAYATSLKLPWCLLVAL